MSEVALKVTRKENKPEILGGSKFLSLVPRSLEHQANSSGVAIFNSIFSCLVG